MKHNSDKLKEISQRLEKVVQMIEELFEKLFKTEERKREDQQDAETKN